MTRTTTFASTLLALLAASCGSDSMTPDKPLPPTDPQALLSTLNDLAAFGNKHAGSPEGAAAAQYIAKRFTDAGLEDVHMETFAFPRWDLASKSMAVTIDGQPAAMEFDVFESSGAGIADADVVDVGTATDAELANVDLTGKIALVVRNPSFHRAAQYRNVTAKGAAAMLYLSVAPENLIQVGSVRFDWESLGTIPAVTVGGVDGDMIKTSLAQGHAVHAHIEVTAASNPGTGANVVAKITGESPEIIVMGAHYDTWFAGSADNGGGVAELIDVAERRAGRKPHYTLVFVAYDGEEVGLYGGYDYLRKHDVVGKEPILAVLNFESPSAKDADVAGLVHSNQPALDFALRDGGLPMVYKVYAGLEIVADLFGGIIPTDIQGTYRSGVPTATTAATNNYYHTVKDTPDTVDLDLLAASADAFDRSLDSLYKDTPDQFKVIDDTLWQATLTATPGAMLAIDATITDGSGAPQPDIHATASVMVDDFTQVATLHGTTDASGKVHFETDGAVAQMGSGNRFVHVTAGPEYPLVEKIVALP